MNNQIGPVLSYSIALDSDQFDLIRQVYTIVSYIACIPGLILNCLLLWLVLNKTPAPMMSCQKLLMAPCIIDIIIASWTFIVQPIPIVFHGYHAVVQNGYFQHAPQSLNYTANTLWFQFLFIFLCITTLQFVYRYYMSFNNGEIPRMIKFGATFIVLFLLFVHIGLHYWSDYPYNSYKPEMEYLAKLVYDEIGLTKVRFSSFCYARSFPWIMHCIAMVVLFAFCYLIIIYSFVKTRVYFRSAAEYNDGIKSRRLLKLQNQITWALCLQAILPTINVSELIIQTTALPILLPGVRTIHVMVYAAIPLYFIPLLNPFIIIATVNPYWRAVLSMIPFYKKNNTIYTSSTNHFFQNRSQFQQRRESILSTVISFRSRTRTLSIPQRNGNNKLGDTENL